MIKKTYLVLITIILCACSQEDKPNYILGDSTLRNFEGGDQLTYSVLQDDTDSFNQYSLKLESETLFDVNSNTVETLKEVYTGTDSFSPPFLSRSFVQDDTGNWSIQAISQGTDTFWLLDEDKNPDAQIYYHTDPANSAALNNFDEILWVCENQVCENSGSLNLQLEYLGIENVSTPYADFETFKFQILLTITISANSLNTTSKFYQVGGQEWLHPSLGVVKHSYDILDDDQLHSLIAHLTQTNVRIPEELKQ